MKIALVSSLALVSLTAGALAADLPGRSMAPVPAATAAIPSFVWSGFYGGVHAGLAWSDVTARPIASGGPLIPPVDILIGGGFPASTGLNSDGLMLGGQVGYNAQFGAIVAGLEADISWADVSRSKATTLTGLGGPPVVLTLRSNLDWLGTVRGRIGVAFDRALVYATGGLAFGDTSYRSTIDVDGIGSLAGSSSEVSTGYAVGGGVEWAFTDTVTLKAEWLYYDLGRQTVRVAGTAGLLTSADHIDFRFENDGHLGRLGINVRF